ncbi:MAG: helix-turn-helix domain-containing protein [Xanthomonadales bacterium]|nr:helix-turn-helix domain-containing protein [Xanthomonadales bacterium]
MKTEKQKSQRAETLWISDPEQLAALISPVRQGILDRLEAAGPSTVADLAEALGIAQDALYYHVRKLEGVGLLRRVDVRKGEGRDSAVFDLAARRWHIRYRPGDPENEACLSAITAGILRQAQRDFEQGFAAPGASVEGELRSLWSLRLESSLDEADLRAVNRHLNAIVEILRKPRRQSGGNHYALSWVLAPMQRRGRN